MIKNILVYTLCASLIVGTTPYTFAHGDEVHEDAHTTTVSEAELARMEQLIKLLQELVTLMSALKIQQSYAPVIPPQAETHTDDTEDVEMEMHHEEHSNNTETTTNTTEAKLVIEVERHNDRTHVHTRYVDKPEVMFFVDANMDDEAGLIEDIHEYTGLDSEVIKAALKYYR